MLSEDSAHDVFVDLDPKRVRNLLGNSRPTEARIAVLHFEDRRDEFLRVAGVNYFFRPAVLIVGAHSRALWDPAVSGLLA